MKVFADSNSLPPLLIFVLGIARFTPLKKDKIQHNQGKISVTLPQDRYLNLEPFVYGFHTSQCELKINVFTLIQVENDW